MRKTGSRGFVAATVLLVLIAVFSFAGTAVCRAESCREDLENHYMTLERQLVQDTRDYLELRGFSHSGVMLNRVVDADGSREYTVTIHHRAIDRMPEQERMELAAALGELAFELEDGSFGYEFLTE
ncbi:MAG: hypothetical protein OSJ69_07000 [Acetatifactor sp.]|nr:hypothetical protein [Acetatifactor sp.]